MRVDVQSQDTGTTPEKMPAKHRLFIANIPYSATENDIRDFLRDYRALGIRIITDRETGQSRGFAFAELQSADDVEAAVADLDGTDLGGRKAVVKVAHEREASGRG